MKKKLLSLVCALALTLTLLPSAAALEGDGERAAAALSSLGLVSGTSAGFETSSPATQEHAAALLVRLLGAQSAANADRRNCGWKNVPRWAWSAVNYCAYHNLILPEEYRPGGEVSGELWCAMLLRALGYGTEEGISAATTALRMGLIPRALSETLTRGELFESALAALTYPAADGSTPLDTLLRRGLCPQDAAQALGLLSDRLTARQTADRCLSAVLCLELYDSAQALHSEEASANSSAFLISSDGLAVTNYHSIEGAVAGRATLVTGEVFEISRVIYYDTALDLAVIRIADSTADGKAVRFNAIPLAGAQEVRVGDVLYAIGNPLSLGLSMSQGIVSSTSHTASFSSAPCILSDAAISQGSSGGVLLNECGHAVAVTSGAYTYGNEMYLSIPLDPILASDLTVEGQTLEQVVEAETAARDAMEQAASDET